MTTHSCYNGHNNKSVFSLITGEYLLWLSSLVIKSCLFQTIADVIRTCLGPRAMMKVSFSYMLKIFSQT